MPRQHSKRFPNVLNHTLPKNMGYRFVWQAHKEPAMSLAIKAAGLSTVVKESARGFAVNSKKFGAPPSLVRSCEPDGEATTHKGSFTLLRGNVPVDCVCAFLLSTGICLVLVDRWEALALPALSVVVFAFFCLRWWIAPLVCLPVLGAVGLYLHLSGQLTYYVYNLTALLIWTGQRWPEDAAISQNAEMMTLFWYLLICTVTLVVFIMMRRFFSLLLVIASFVVAIFAVSDLSTMGTLNLAAPLSLFVAGVVILLPRVYSRCIRKRGLPASGRTFMQAIAVPGALLAVLLSLVIAPQPGSHIRWQPLANLFYDIGYYINPSPSHYASNFEIHTFGFGASPERLGGPVVLAEGYIVTVVTNKPLLLNGSVMDYYTGYTWLPGEDDSSLRFNSFLWRSPRADAFDFDMPTGGAAARELFYSVTTEVTMDITYAAEFYTTLFSSAGLREVSISASRLNNEIFFNARSELYMTTPVPMGEVVSIRARALDRDAIRFEENFLRLEQVVGEDPRFGYIYARYTLLPESLPDTVRQTALYVVGDETSPFLKATAIAQWLGENFYYTLTPVTPPEGVDFVAHFLETGEGYCTYYATAMAVMARAVGLPSRYVVGLALARDLETENVFHASGRTVHAWAEIYFYGIGWIPFDPLEWNADIPLNIPTGGLGDTGESWGDDWGEYWDLVLGLMDDGIVREQAQAFNILPYFALAGVLLLGAAIRLALLWNNRRREYSPTHAARKIPNSTERFKFFYADIIEQLSILGMGINPGETLSAYSQRMEAQLARQIPQNSAFIKVMCAQMLLHFANIPPDVSDVEAAEKLHGDLEKILRGRFSPPAYLWRRAMRKTGQSTPTLTTHTY